MDTEALGLETWPVIVPTGEPMPGMWIADAFREMVLMHIIKNHLPQLRPPLMLAVQGKKGEGKSMQVRAVCQAAGVYLIPLSGAALGGSEERAAVVKLESAYRFASAVSEATECMVALLVDDFDLSVASAFDGVRVTVNTQLLNGFLMNLADDPNRCGQHETRRVPIILTGNNFTALYGPLTRHGRMNFYEWKPSLDERKAMVAAMFEGVIADDEMVALDELVEAYRHQPLSFFAALKDDAANEAILDLLREPKPAAVAGDADAAGVCAG